jgi:hypothetical protein
MPFAPSGVVGPAAPPIQPPQPAPPGMGGQSGPSNPLPPGSGGGTPTPGPWYRPPVISTNPNPSPGYTPPAGSPPILPSGGGPAPGAPPPGGDPYGSDNWKSPMPPMAPGTVPSVPGSSSTGTGTVVPGTQTNSPTGTPQYKAAQKQGPGAPPIRPPTLPSPSGGSAIQPTIGTGASATGSLPEYPNKEAERSRQNRRSGTNFGIREKLASTGASGYTKPNPNAALTGSGAS